MPYEFVMKKIFPTELIEFLQCRHMAKLRQLGVLPDAFISEEVSLLREKGIEHEKNFFESLKGEVISIDTEASIDEQYSQTVEAMDSGADWIYQAYLQKDDCAGYADFLQKKKGESSLGDFFYEVIDTKLSTRPSPANAIQLIHYSELVSQEQELQANDFHVVHGDNSKTTLQRSDIIHYYHEILKDYKAFIHGKEFTEPFPIPACKQCGYQTHCQDYLQSRQHLALIPNISVNQMDSLKSIGVKKITDLSTATETPKYLSKISFEEIKTTAESVLQHELKLKSLHSFNQLKHSLKDSLFFLIHKNFQPQDGAITFFMAVMTDSNRYESVIHHNASEEKKSLQRMISFVSRYLNRFPHAKLLVSNNSDARILHDLSNRYNICHDELDEIMIKKKIISFRSLFQQSFIFPSGDISSKSILSQLDPSIESHSLIEKSPQLLYELFHSLGLTDSLDAITQRAQLELELHFKCLHHLSALSEEDFPLTLNAVVLNE